MVGLLDDNSKNYIAVVQYLQKCHSTAVDEPIDPTIMDTSYDPASTVKSIKQQQKILSEAEIRAIIQKYKAGASTYQLAEEFGCHRRTIANNLRKQGIEVSIEKINLEEAIKLYELGWTTKQLAERYHMSDNAVSRRLKANGVKMRTRWDYKK